MNEPEKGAPAPVAPRPAMPPRGCCMLFDLDEDAFVRGGSQRTIYREVKERGGRASAYETRGLAARPLPAQSSPYVEALQHRRALRSRQALHGSAGATLP